MIYHDVQFIENVYSRHSLCWLTIDSACLEYVRLEYLETPLRATSLKLR